MWCGVLFRRSWQVILPSATRHQRASGGGYMTGWWRKKKFCFLKNMFYFALQNSRWGGTASGERSFSTLKLVEHTSALNLQWRNSLMTVLAESQLSCSFEFDSMRTWSRHTFNLFYIILFYKFETIKKAWIRLCWGSLFFLDILCYLIYFLDAGTNFLPHDLKWRFWMEKIDISYFLM